jgi:hypothetical protein
LERLAARPPQDGTIPADWRQGSVSELARQADLVRDAPDRRRRWLVAGVAVVVVGVVGFALWLGFSAAPDTHATTAAEVAEAMTDNLADAPFVVGRQTISGTTPSGRTERYRLLHASSGSFRLRGVAGSASFDAAAGTTRELNPVPGDVSSMLVLDGLATGPPDPVGGNRYRFEDDLALVARTLLNAGDAPVREAERSGRDVWLLSQPVDRADNGIDRIDVSVDRKTSLPVEVARYRSDRLVERRVFDDLQVRSTVPPGSFVQPTPSGATVRTVDRGFRHMPLPQVGAAVGYDPVTPAWLPDGFELANVAVLRGTRASAASAGVENPPDTDVISLAYRRGVQQVTVSTRRDGGPTVDWVDPFGTNQADQPEEVRLQAGRFHGTTVQEVAGDPVAPPHLWGRADGIVFTLAGDVSPAELRRMAESLQ